MDNILMSEAFKALDLLEEDMIDLTSSNKDELDKFIDKSDDSPEEVNVIDLDATTEDDLDDDNVGKIIIQCPCCLTILMKKKEDVDLPEDLDGAEDAVVLEGEQCPVCFSEEGYKIIGKVAPLEEITVEVTHKNADDFQDDSVNEDQLEDDNVEDEELDDNGLKESLFESKNPYALRRRTSFNPRVTKDLTKCDGHDYEYIKDDHDRHLDDIKANVKVQSREPLVDKTYNEIEEEFNKALKNHRRFCKDCDNSRISELEVSEDLEYINNDDLDPIVNEALSDEDLSIMREVVSEMRPEWLTNELLQESKINEENISAESILHNPDDAMIDEINTLLFNLDMKESLDEGLNDIQLETDSDKISIHAEKKYNGDEMIVPLDYQDANEIVDNQEDDQEDENFLNDVETEDNIESDAESISDEDEELADLNSESVEEGAEEVPEDMPIEDEDETLEDAEEGDNVDMDVDELDKKAFESLSSSYLREAYDNVNSFKINSMKHKDNGIVCEGIINFASGNNYNTKFILEGLSITRDGRCRIVVENDKINTGKSGLIMEGRINGKKLIPESLEYNYKQNGQILRGTVNR